MIARASSTRPTSLGVLVIALFMTTAAPVFGQVTATWTGTAGDGLYCTPTNWDIGVVPVNDATTTYCVVIPGGVTVEFDCDDPADVTDFELGAGSTFAVRPGHSLTSLDDTRVFGRITTNNGAFQAAALGASLLGN